MNLIEFGTIIFAILVIVGVILLLFNKTEVKKITLTNSEGKSIEVNAEIADNWLSLAKGLMGRKELPENAGMLFVFDRPDYHSLWMLNTTIPLDAIFFDESGTVIDIIKMDPCKSITCPSYSPKGPAKYILEVNQGFSKKNKIKVSGGQIYLAPLTNVNIK